jgi:hypothetical protein
MKTPPLLQDLLETEFEPGVWRDDLAIITGARTNLQIVELVEQLVQQELDQTIRGGLFAEKSVGAVFGLDLSSGDRVVLKLFHPSQSPSQLAAMHRCLDKVVKAGFPAPPPRSRLFQTEDGITGIFYSFMDGTMGNPHEAPVRQELARALAKLTEILIHEESSDLPLAPTRGSALWPSPYRCYLKLDETPESKWIDDIARRAQSIIQAQASPLLPAHLDWGAKNCRFDQNQICVVYDWDSLCAASEAEMVGRAAAQFTAQSQHPVPVTPSPIEARQFIKDYENARGQRFTQDEQAVLSAAADYIVAHIARQELAAGSLHSHEGFFGLLQNHGSGMLLATDTD